MYLGIDETDKITKLIGFFILIPNMIGIINQWVMFKAPRTDCQTE